MRILLIAGAFPPGRCGVGDYVYRLAQALAHVESLQVAVLTQSAANRVPPPGVAIFGVAASWRMRELPRLLRRIRQWRPDLVHIHWPSQGFGWRLAPALLPIAARLAGARIVQTWHEPWPLKDAFRFMLQRAPTDGLIFVRPNFESLMPRTLLRFMPGGLRKIITSAGALPASTLSAEGRVELRARLLASCESLVVFFGFVYPEKGVDQLFEIAEPGRHALVIAGSVLDAAYRARLDEIARARGWGEQVQYTGFLEAAAAADLLYAADAVVLPFVAGGGEWNTSIHGALAQGTLVITTSANPRGDDPARNLYTARIGDTAGMKAALGRLAGRRVGMPTDDGWGRIASEHIALYQQILQSRSSK